MPKRSQDGSKQTIDTHALIIFFSEPTSQQLSNLPSAFRRPMKKIGM
jgi:hypothetical protein